MTNRNPIYKCALHNKGNEPPNDWPPHFVFNESVIAGLLGVSRRTLLRWRHKGIGPVSEPYNKWTAYGNSRFYRLSVVLAWRNQILNLSPANSIEIEVKWSDKYGWMHKNGIPLPAQPKLVEGWRKKGECRRSAKCRRTRKIKCDLARIEYDMDMLLLEQKVNDRHSIT